MLGLLAAFGNIDLIAATLYVKSAPPRERRAGAAVRIEPFAIGAYLGMIALYAFVFSHGMPV